MSVVWEIVAMEVRVAWVPFGAVMVATVLGAVELDRWRMRRRMDALTARVLADAERGKVEA